MVFFSVVTSPSPLLTHIPLSLPPFVCTAVINSRQLLVFQFINAILQLLLLLKQVIMTTKQ